MNMSSCVSQLIQQLGLTNIVLPFVDKETQKPIPVETVVFNVLKTSTIPTFSEFVPWKREGSMATTDLKCVDQKAGIYMLPDFLTMTPVMYVIDVRLPYHNNRGTYGDIAPAYGINRSVQGVATSQAYMMLAGQMRSEPTFDYLGYNKIRLYGYPRTMLTFVLACQHMPNGETIKDSCRSSFMELADIHCRMFLYNQLKFYNNLPTAFSNVELPISDWQGAQQELNTLLDGWRDRFHVDMDIWDWM